MRLPPKVKFQPEARAEARARKIAEYHSLGTQGASVNEFARLVFNQLSLVKPDQLFLALAALEPFQTKRPNAGLFAPKTAHVDPTKPERVN